MKIITIRFPDGVKTDGMIDVESKELCFNYVDLSTHHGLQCNFEYEGHEYNRLLNILKEMTDLAREAAMLSDPSNINLLFSETIKQKIG